MEFFFFLKFYIIISIFSGKLSVFDWFKICLNNKRLLRFLWFYLLCYYLNENFSFLMEKYKDIIRLDFWVVFVFLNI